MLKYQAYYKKVPTLITIGNSLCGFFAILYTLTAYERVLGSYSTFEGINIDDVEVLNVFSFSSGLILLAMVFDACDGWLARKLHAVSEHGKQMDSLCDMVTFGVAPAVIVAVHSHIQGFIKSPLANFASYPWLWTACCIYIGCAALRLAWYNVGKEPSGKNHFSSDKYFRGLPTPAAAAAICSIFFAKHLYYNQFDVDTINWVLGFFLPFYMALIGLLMNSSIPYLHIGKWFVSQEKIFFKLALLSAGLIYVIGDFTPIVLVNIYILSGPFNLLIMATKRKGKSK